MGTNISEQLIYGNPFIWSNFILFCAPKFPKILASLNIQKLVSVPCVIFPRNFEILVFPLVLYHFSKYVSTRKKTHCTFFPFRRSLCQGSSCACQDGDFPWPWWPALWFWVVGSWCLEWRTSVATGRYFKLSSSVPCCLCCPTFGKEKTLAFAALWYRVILSWFWYSVKLKIFFSVTQQFKKDT